MITFVNSEKEWPRWNELIFTEGKPAIVFSMSRSHPIFPDVRDMLNTFKKTHVYCLQPSHCRKLLKGRDEYVDPPCIIAYDKGECVFKYIMESISGNMRVVASLDEVEFELSKLFI